MITTDDWYNFIMGVEASGYLFAIALIISIIIFVVVNFIYKKRGE